MTKFKFELDLRKRNNFHTLHRDSRTRLMRTFEKGFKNYNKYLNCFGLNLHKIEIKPITADSSFQLKHIDNTNNNDKEEIALTIQKAKDKINISGKSYIQLKKIFKQIPNVNLPGLNQIDLIKEKMNKFFEINQNENGAYLNVREKIHFILNKIYIKSNKKVENNTFHLRFAGDSAMITKTRLILMNFTFCVLNSKKCNAESNYILGIFKIESENYDSIKAALDPIIEQLKDFNTISIDNKEFIIEKYASGDLKFLSLAFGINAANATFPCIWCEWSSKDKI